MPGQSQINLPCNWLNIALLTIASTESVKGSGSCAP